MYNDTKTFDSAEKFSKWLKAERKGEDWWRNESEAPQLIKEILDAIK